MKQQYDYIYPPRMPGELTEFDKRVLAELREQRAKEFFSFFEPLLTLVCFLLSAGFALLLVLGVLFAIFGALSGPLTGGSVIVALWLASGWFNNKK